MNCNLSDNERKTGNRCRSWDCIPCKEFGLTANDATIINVHMDNITLREELRNVTERRKETIQRATKIIKRVYRDKNKLLKENKRLKEQLDELRLSIPHINGTKDSYIARIKKANEMLENILEYSIIYTPIREGIEAVINTLNGEQKE